MVHGPAAYHLRFDLTPKKAAERDTEREGERMGPIESHCMRIFREYSPILVNGPTILHVCNHFSIHSNKKIMPVFRDFPLFVKLDLTLNKLPRQAGMSMPSAPHLCQELLVDWTGESIWVYILIYMVCTIHVGMMICELKMSIYHIYIEPSVSIVR